MSVLTRDSDDPKSGPPDGRHPFRAVAASIGLTALAVLLSLVGGIAFVLPMLLLAIDLESTLSLLALTVAGQAGFLVAGYVYASRRGIRIRIAWPGAKDLGYAVGGALCSLVAVTLLSIVITILDLLPSSVLGDAIALDPAIALGLAVLSVVVIAPVEEFLFRGVIQGRLRRAFGPAGAVAGSSLLFGAVHLANYAGNLSSVVAGALLIAVGGSVLGVLQEVRRNLAVPIVAHALYNLVLLSIAYAGA